MKVPYFKQIDKSVVFDGEYMEIYIPKSNFEARMAYLKGENVETLGFFNFLVYHNGNRDPKKAEFRSLSLPFKMQFQFRKFFDIKTKIRDNIEEDSYRVFVLEKGDLFCVSTEFAKNAENTKNLVFQIHGGHLPSSIEYKKVLDCYLGTGFLNGVNYNVPSVACEIIVSELCRYKEDLTVPFRIALNKNNKLTQYDYTSISIKKLPALNSTFTAITFEDINNAIITSIKKAKNNEEEKETPVEKVLML